MASPDLSKMVGPMPLGAWLGLVGGGLAFMIYQRKQADVTAANNTATVDTSGVPGVGDGTVGGWQTTSPPDTSVTTDNGPTTNEEWGRQATNWLIAQGYNPLVADSAIRKYLDQSQAYSSQEYAMVSLAIGHLGSTPTPLPAPIFGAPTPPRTPSPVTHTTYTIRTGDTLRKIAAQVYGSDAYAYVQKIRTANPFLLTFTGAASLNHWSGKVIVIPYMKPVAKSTPVPVKVVPVKDHGPVRPVQRAPVRHYTVRPGDTLSRIAQKYYHNPKEWSRIYNANRGKISNPNVVHVGTVLTIP